jgi:hypothetical protein
MVARPLLTPAAADVNAAHSRAERVFILERYLASKSFAVVREAVSSA